MFQNMIGRNLQGALAVALTASGIVWASWALSEGTGLRAEVRQVPAAQHFQSGGARSEAVLVEIAASLKRIESRLERLEQIAQRCAPPTTGPATNGERPR